ncbi:MAG: redox-sensing transcriptional repressor Rex [Candidatus Omnitrophica bacterium]|nr:redox-sensing transcriptional repressor Rex [Candidatus Omnitrophota bacterium]
MRPKISRSVIPRLSVYCRALVAYKDSGVISSDKLSELTGRTAAQIRRDIAYFGQFGTPGKGYVVEELKKRILEILGINRIWDVALVGAGNLGAALLSYKGFKEQGFNIAAAFDNDRNKIGKKLRNVPIRHIKELSRVVKNKKIQMAIIAVPAEEAQKVIDTLLKNGVRAILNFAPIRPAGGASTEIINIDLSIELEKLAHFLNRPK